jgi:type I restriction enzyme S subunit
MRFYWENDFKKTDLGNIPAEWNLRTIEKVADFINGFSYTSSEKLYDPGEFIFINLNNIAEGGGFKRRYAWIRSARLVERNFLQDHDLIMANVHFGVGGSGYGRLLGTPAIVEFPKWYDKHKAAFSLDLSKIILKEDEKFKSFLYWFLIATQEDTASFHSGTTIWHLDMPNFKKHKLVIIPSASEKLAIPEVLFLFDKLIDNKQRQNIILEKLAMTIFRDFYKNQTLHNMLVTADETTDNWADKPLDGLFDLEKGKKCDCTEQEMPGYEPYLLIENFEGGLGSLWTENKGPKTNESNVVLVADGERSGKVFRYQRGILGSTLLKLNPKTQTEGLEDFAYLFLKNMEEELMNHTTGSAVPHLDKDFLAQLTVSCPPDNQLLEFHQLVDPLFHKISVNQKQITLFRRTKNTLLPLLVFGKLRLRED